MRIFYASDLHIEFEDNRNALMFDELDEPEHGISAHGPVTIYSSTVISVTTSRLEHPVHLGL